jgi:hypothetical protein
MQRFWMHSILYFIFGEGWSPACPPPLGEDVPDGLLHHVLRQLVVQRTVKHTVLLIKKDHCKKIKIINSFILYGFKLEKNHISAMCTVCTQTSPNCKRKNGNFRLHFPQKETIYNVN